MPVLPVSRQPKVTRWQVFIALAVLRYKNVDEVLTVFVTDGEQTGETGETGVFANNAYRCRRCLLGHTLKNV